MNNKIKFLITLLFVCAFAKAQTVESDLLLQTSHGATTSRTDIIGTPENGMFFYDSQTNRAYVYSNGQWRKVYYAPIINAQTSNYTLTPADDGNVITINSTSDVTLTIPAGLDLGYNVSVYQLGAGKVTITGAAGVSLLNRLSRFKTAGENAGIGIIATATNTFNISGDLKK